MHISTLLSALVSATVSCLPVDQIELNNSSKGSIGQICTDSEFSGSCTDLILSIPNECVTSKSGALPYNRAISSLSISTSQTCAFFTLEACINPAGTHGMVVQGPAQLSELPGIMDDTIQAYICGARALKFAPNSTLAPGTVIVDDLSKCTISTGDENEDEDEDLEVFEDAVTELQARKATPPPKASFVANDGRGATIWKQQNMIGDIVPADQTAVPGNAWCTNLNNIFGGWDKKVRSLVVQDGYKCQFYTEYDCPTAGLYLDLGSKDDLVLQPTLTADFDLKIHSVFCAAI